MSYQGAFKGQNDNGVLVFQSEDGLSYQFAFKLNQPIQPYNGHAIVQGDINQCVGTREFSGVIGPTSFKLDLHNGVILQGNLSAPLPEGCTVNGHGVWAIN